MSGPQEYVVEVPPLIQPERLLTVENTHQVTQCELLHLHSAFKNKTCPRNWAIFPAVLYAPLLKMTEALPPLILFVLFLFFHF